MCSVQTPHEPNVQNTRRTQDRLTAVCAAMAIEKLPRAAEGSSRAGDDRSGLARAAWAPREQRMIEVGCLTQRVLLASKSKTK